MMEHPKVLVVSSDHENREQLVRVLSMCGLRTVVTKTMKEGLARIHHGRYSMVICESALPDGSYRDVLRAATEEKWGKPVVVASRLDDAQTYLDAMRLGAFDFIASPYGRSEVERIVNQAMEKAFAA